jgi:hypothetical protein
MSRTRFTVPQVLEALYAACDAAPYYEDRRARCSYLEDGKPTCLDAVILAQLGVSVGLLRDLDKEGARIDHTRHPLRRRFTPEAWELLAYLQRCNDAGQVWRRIGQEVNQVDGYWWRVKRAHALAQKPWVTEQTAVVPHCPGF